jgi:hypothetical protein
VENYGSRDWQNAVVLLKFLVNFWLIELSCWSRCLSVFADQIWQVHHVSSLQDKKYKINPIFVLLLWSFRVSVMLVELRRKFIFMWEKLTAQKTFFGQFMKPKRCEPAKIGWYFIIHANFERFQSLPNRSFTICTLIQPTREYSF